MIFLFVDRTKADRNIMQQTIEPTMRISLKKILIRLNTVSTCSSAIINEIDRTNTLLFQTFFSLWLIPDRSQCIYISAWVGKANANSVDRYLRPRHCTNSKSLNLIQIARNRNCHVSIWFCSTWTQAIQATFSFCHDLVSVFLCRNLSSYKRENHEFIFSRLIEFHFCLFIYQMIEHNSFTVLIRKHMLREQLASG